MHTKEERIEMGRKALDELRGMFKAWLASDFNWALEKAVAGEVSGKEGEWDFLWEEWLEKLSDWMSPYVSRLREAEYINDEDLNTFGEEMANNMRVMLETIYVLSEGLKNEQDV